jgi:hypothetical protein
VDNFDTYIFFSFGTPPRKKKKLADKILPQKVRDMVPESQAYMDLLAFERKLDATIMRKRLDIQVRFLFVHYIFELSYPRIFWNILKFFHPID